MKIGNIVILTFLSFLFINPGFFAEEIQSDDKNQPEISENPVVFWELASHDADKSVQFFEKIFDWKIEMIPNTIIHGVNSRSTGKGIDGGIFTLRKSRLPFLTIYILVDDIKEKAKLIEENGGLIVEPPHEISENTWICLFTDPSGVTFAMLQKTKRKN